MANADAPFGLKPVVYGDDDLIECAILSTDTNVIYINTPVTLQTSGSNSAAIGDAAIGTLPVVSVAGSTGTVFGSVIGFKSIAGVSDDIVYNPASTARIAQVVRARDGVMFQIQTEGTLTATSVGLNANLINAGSGSTTTGRSTAQLDFSTAATTSTLQLRIEKLSNLPDNEMGADAIVDVTINNTNDAPNTAGI